MFTEDIAHEAVEDRMAAMDEMDTAMHDDPALEWDEDPRAAMYDAMADEFATAELTAYLDAQDAEYALTIDMEDPT